MCILLWVSSELKVVSGIEARQIIGILLDAVLWNCCFWIDPGVRSPRSGICDIFTDLASTLCALADDICNVIRQIELTWFVQYKLVAACCDKLISEITVLRPFLPESAYLRKNPTLLQLLPIASPTTACIIAKDARRLRGRH